MSLAITVLLVGLPLHAEPVEYSILTDAPQWKEATWVTQNRTFKGDSLKDLFQRISKQDAPAKFNVSTLLSRIGEDGWMLKTHSIIRTEQNSLHQVWTFSRSFKVIEDISSEKLDIRITGDWLGGPPANIKAVCLSSASEIWQYFPGRKVHPIVVERSASGPMVTFKRGPKNEYKVLLNTQGTFWAQYSYQFAHEFCHIMCNYDPAHNNQWFEETLCEMASMFSLRKMAETWKTKPPYGNWKGYSKALSDYSDNLLKEGVPPEGQTFLDWFKKDLPELTKSGGGKRAKNKIVAAQLLPLFEAKPDQWPAVQFLNSWTEDGNQPFDQFLQSWKQNSPENYRAFIDSIALKLGFKLE